MIARCILAVYPIPLRRITRLVLSHGRSNVVQSSLLTTSQNLSTLSTPFSSSVHLEEEATLTAPVPRRSSLANLHHHRHHNREGSELALAGRHETAYAAMSEPEQFEKANLEFLYEALSEPVSVHSSTPTFPSSPVLDSSFLRDIKFQYEEQARNEVTEIKQLQREILGRSEQRLQDQMSLAHICQVIKINALLKRPVEAEQAFNLIHKWRLEPNTESVNELLLAYSEVGDWEKTLTTYRQHFEVIDSSGRFAASSSATSSHTSSQSSLTASALSSTSLTTLKSANTNPASLINHQNQANLLIPNEETFKHVIRALTKQGQLKQALELEAKWRNSGTVTLPQSIYTDIIACTIKNGQVDRAWEIFNYMQTYLHAPNSIAFTLMIKACAIRQEAERALDLVTRMTDSNVPLSDMAFTFLIQAVGSRPDYYAESFRLFEQMILQGFTPNLYTYNALLDSCSKHGDIARARMIWNDMMQRYLDDRLSSSSSSSAASSSMKPNIYIVQSMFKVFSHALKLYGKQDPKTEPIWGLPAFTSTQPEAEEPLRVPVSSDSNTHGIIFQTGKITPQLVVAEANALMSYISGLGKEEGGEESIGVGGTDKLTSLDTRLVNTYLSVIAHSGIRDVESFETGLLAVYKEMFTIENGPWGQRVSHLGYKMKPDGFTHFLLLKAASRKKDVFEKYGIDLWKQFVEWDNEQERQLVEMVAPVMEDQIQDKGLENHLTDDTGIRNGSGGSAFGSFLSPVLSEQEKEEKRLQQSRDKNVVFKMLVFMVKGYTRLGEYEKALDFIHQASVFRTPGYLEKIHFEHVWILFEKANELAEDGHLEVAKRLVELCPKPTETALEEVMRIRKTSIMNRSWWGWDALGVGKATRGRLLAEQNRKERQRRKRR